MVHPASFRPFGTKKVAGLRALLTTSCLNGAADRVWACLCRSIESLKQGVEAGHRPRGTECRKHLVRRQRDAERDKHIENQLPVARRIGRCPLLTRRVGVDHRR
jgi:hypothetical protein